MPIAQIRKDPPPYLGYNVSEPLCCGLEWIKGRYIKFKGQLPEQGSKGTKYGSLQLGTEA